MTFWCMIPDTGLVCRFLFFHRRASKDPDRTHVHVLVRARVSPMWRARVEAGARGLAYQQYRRPARGCCFGICVSPLLAGGTPDRRAGFTGSVRYKQFSNPPAHWKRGNNAGESETEKTNVSIIVPSWFLPLFLRHSSSTVASLVLYKTVV